MVCVGYQKRAELFVFGRFFWLLFCRYKKVTMKNSEIVFLPNPYDGHMAFQMLTA